jgi:hypothetical protein
MAFFARIILQITEHERWVRYLGVMPDRTPCGNWVLQRWSTGPSPGGSVDWRNVGEELPAGRLPPDAKIPIEHMVTHLRLAADELLRSKGGSS